MGTTEAWILPLVILPGVALLIMSTSVRFARLHDEIDHMLDASSPNHDGARNLSASFAVHLRRRAALFHNALVSLYVSVAIFAICSILGAASSLLGLESDWPIVVLVGVGILALVYASVTLIRESMLTLVVIDQHLEKLRRERS